MGEVARRIILSRAPLKIGDEIVAEFGAFDFGRACHLAGEFAGDALGCDGAIQPAQNSLLVLHF